MDNKTATSASDSFFFQLIPKHFKVDHGFAKTIKPNTSYRLCIFKGIQKAEEMAEPIKGKLVRGKILFDRTVLNFYLPLYSPARNIEFTVKVLESRPNQEESEIAAHKLKSGDFIKQFRSEGISSFKEQVPLAESLALAFDLFLHSSKSDLDKIVAENLQKSKLEARSSLFDKRGTLTPRRNEASSEILSQSDASESYSLNGNNGVFASKKKLVRKRGHDGKLRSRHGSREGSEVGSSRSKSSRHSFGPFPHNEQNQHFIRSPKKVSPPKVEGSSQAASQVKPSEVKPAKRENLVAVGRRQSQYGENEGSRNATPTKMGKVQSSRQRSQSANKARISALGITTLTTDRKGNATAKSELHQQQVQTKQNMFEIKRKTQSKVSQTEKRTLASRVQGGKSPRKSVLESKSPQTEHAVEREPISKPTEWPLKKKQSTGNEVKSQSEAEEPSGQRKDKLSQKSKQRLSHVQIKTEPGVEQGEPRQMKASIRLPSAALLEPEAEEQAGREYQGLKDKLFYLLFAVFSAVLFWNAVTPSRKV